ncbi:MAG: hypothetical protein QXV73_04120 [Candidatus Micrarchaeia archaeon]
MAWDDYEEKLKLYEQKIRELEESLAKEREEKKQINDIIQKAYLDPKKRQALKEIVSIAGMEIEDPVYEKVAKEEISSVKSELEKLKEEKAKEQARQYEEQFRLMMEKYGIKEEELPQVKEFINETKLMPTSLEGWELVFQNYKRNKVASPTFIGANDNIFQSTLKAEDYIKNPKQAFYRLAEQALKGGR